MQGSFVRSCGRNQRGVYNRYFNGDEFSEDEIRQALRVNVMDGSIVPVLMGSNPLARGMYTLMADIVKYFPSGQTDMRRHQYDKQRGVSGGL